MKLESFNEEYYRLFIHNEQLKNSELDSKDEVISLVKEMIIKVQDLYSFSLRGFYQVNVYVNKRVGIYLEIERLETIDYGNNLDLKIIVHMNQIFYYQVENYDHIPKNTNTFFDGEYYYIHVEEVSIMDIIEYADIAYGYEIEKKIKRSRPIKKH